MKSSVLLSVTDLAGEERDLILAFRQYRSALTGGNASAIVAAEGAFLEMAQAAVDISRNAALPPGAMRRRDHHDHHEGDRRMDERDENKDEGKGPSDQGDGATGAGQSTEASETPADEASSREAAGQMQSEFRTT